MRGRSTGRRMRGEPAGRCMRGRSAGCRTRGRSAGCCTRGGCGSAGRSGGRGGAVRAPGRGRSGGCGGSRGAWARTGGRWRPWGCRARRAAGPRSAMWPAGTRRCAADRTPASRTRRAHRACRACRACRARRARRGRPAPRRGWSGGCRTVRSPTGRCRAAVARSRCRGRRRAVLEVEAHALERGARLRLDQDLALALDQPGVEVGVGDQVLGAGQRRPVRESSRASPGGSPSAACGGARGERPTRCGYGARRCGTRPPARPGCRRSRGPRTRRTAPGRSRRGRRRWTR